MTRLVGPAVVPVPLSPARAASCLLLFLCVLAWLLLLGERLLQDGDTFWHIRAGEMMLDTLALPRTDAFSHSFAGAPWIAKEWLAQVMLAAAWRAGGWGGVVLVSAASFALAAALLFGFLMRRIRATQALMIVLIALLLASAQVLARPQVFFFPLLVVWFGALVAAVERRAPPPWWLLGVMALWANLHPSFPIGLVLAALLGAEAVIATRRAGLALRWLAFGLAALLATGVTPYGFEPLWLSVVTVGGNATLRFIDEWQPMGADPALLLPALLLGAVALAALRAGPLPRLLPVALTAWMMVSAVRFASLFAFVAPMAAAGPLGASVAACAPQRDEGARPTPLLRGAIGAMAAAVLALVLLLRPAPPPTVAPAAALDAALAAGVTGPVYNAFEFGGFLVWRGVPSFIDGRTDQLFLGDFVPDLLAAENAADAAAFRALLARHRIGWALVRTGGAAAAKLDHAPGWTLVHRDAVASAYSRR